MEAKGNENQKMNAIVYTEYGSPEVLKLTEVDKPTPKDNEILIRIYATTVNYGDIVARNFRNISPSKFAMPFLFWIIGKMAMGFRKPRKKILGNEFSGVIESVGKNVTLFKEGDPVFGYTSQGMGAYAEYICLQENKIVVPKPTNVTFEEAAVVPMGGIFAINLLKKGNIQPGQKVLVNGASGGIGSAAVQLAKSHYGAEVTGVCSTPRLDFVRSLGADKVIDYTKEDFTQSGEIYDVIFDCSTSKKNYSRVKNSLSPTGRYILSSFKMRNLGQMLRTKMFGSKRVMCPILPQRTEDISEVKELIEEGKLKAVIDKRFPLGQTAEAHRYVEEGHKRGHIIIQVFHP